jgi:putative transposase
VPGHTEFIFYDQSIERTFAWLSRVRRLSKDYERLPKVAEAMIYGVMSHITLRRLAKGAA